jgi:FkbH-like protein
MKLIEAIEINNAAAAAARTRRYFLVCGFEALHLRSFLNAHLQIRFPQDKIDVAAGVFGDLAGNVSRARAADAAGTAVIVEWPDLDPRLGFRQLAAWTPEMQADILRTVEMNTARLRSELDELEKTCPVALCLPSLPLPPLASTPGTQAAAFELELACHSAMLGKWAAANRRIRVVNADRMDEVSPRATRRDVNSEMFNGFPYSHAHADALASAFAALLQPAAPKKGIITDLDDTFWRGILGEVGVTGVSWDLTHRSQVHGIYQKFLASLASRGVLVGVASKNDAALVEEAFRREDLGMPADRIYPFCVHWRPKSESAAQILRAWNISADSAIFVDDSAMELAEVKAAHPGIECVLFPKQAGKLPAFLANLRDWFGKSAILQEDAIRSESLRSAAAWREAETSPSASFESFLSQAEQRVTISVAKPDATGRAFELVNKTNQFNLNGRRYTEAEWDAYLRRPETFLATIAYTDKFGPLGVISAALGRVEGPALYLDTWVLSCRAFARRIEHQFLNALFDLFHAGEIAIDHIETPRNGPAREFLALFHEPSSNFRITKPEFDRACPALYHSVETNRQ